MLVKHFKQSVLLVAIVVSLSIYVFQIRPHKGTGLYLPSWARRRYQHAQHVFQADTGSNATEAGDGDSAELDEEALSSIYANEEDELELLDIQESMKAAKAAAEKEKESKATGSSKDASKSKDDSSVEDEDEEEEPEEEIIGPSTDVDNYILRTDHHEVFSQTMRNRKFFSIFTGGVKIYNPNIIPHPMRHDLWIVVAQRETMGENAKRADQMVCSAGFLDDVLTCTAEPVVVPVEPSIRGQCQGSLSIHNFHPGPRDARVFYGPDAPYIAYGSQSQYGCLGIWLQDLRTVIDEFTIESGLPTLFRSATEIQLPRSSTPAGPIQKNFFLFWDTTGKTYVHHSLHPFRTFAELSYDGAVGPNLAPFSSSTDAVCMAQFMPHPSEDESIHQATNSLAITLCKRADPGCAPNENNTFVMSIFQHKKYHSFHGEYEPYVLLFSQTPPFAIKAISHRPLWIHGRSALTRETHSVLYDMDPEREIPDGQTEMFYVTSMGWKTHGQKYHGHIDDVLFLGFGIEDTRAAGMDVLAEDLLEDLGWCDGGIGVF